MPRVYGLPHQDILRTTWTEQTRDDEPARNLIGYNIEKNRLEFYFREENQWYYMWQNEISIEKPFPPPFFAEDFENWLIEHNFASEFSENFEMNWLMYQPFSQIFADAFDTGWFEDHNFIQMFSDSFKIDWLTDNPFEEEFLENFEGGDWE